MSLTCLFSCSVQLLSLGLRSSGSCTNRLRMYTVMCFVASIVPALYNWLEVMVMAPRQRPTALCVYTRPTVQSLLHACRLIACKATTEPPSSS